MMDIRFKVHGKVSKLARQEKLYAEYNYNIMTLSSKENEKSILIKALFVTYVTFFTWKYHGL